MGMNSQDAYKMEIKWLRTTVILVLSIVIGLFGTISFNIWSDRDQTRIVAEVCGNSNDVTLCLVELRR